MSIVSSANIYSFLEVAEGYFKITASNDVLIITYDDGDATEIDVADGTYDGDALAATLKTALDTAFSMTSTVSFSSTTRKFTLDAGAEHTFTYTNTGSDGGLTFGFNDDHAAARIITSDVAAGDPTAIVDVIHDSVEDFVKYYCRRIFDSTTYSKEKYDGTGYNILHLKNYPVTALTRVAIGTSDVIRITNTSKYTRASVSVTSTGIILSKDGSDDSTILFANYATISLVVAAINAIGSGWSAEVTSSTYNSFASSELITKFGLNCIQNNYVNLKIPYEGAEDYFDVDENYGIVINNSRSFPKGKQNIFVDYTAGYSTMPDDLQLAVKILVKFWYQRWSEETFGTETFSLGDSSAKIEKILPSDVRLILNRYKKRLV